MESQFDDLPEIEKRQDRLLRSMVKHAYETVPYYRRTMRERRITPSDIRNRNDLDKMPLVKKEDIRSDPSQFHSRSFRDDQCLTLRSSGSGTEKPLSVRHDVDGLLTYLALTQRWNYPINRILRKRFGIRQIYISASSRQGSHITKSVINFSKSLILPRLVRRISFYSVSDPVRKNLDRLNDEQPDILSSQGSYFEILTRYAKENGEQLHAPKVVTFYADHLKESVRETLEKTGSQVFGLYGAAEALGIGYECKSHSGYHVNSDFYVVDIMSSDGGLASDNEIGHVVVTDLTNKAMPIINYELGDVAALQGCRCSCGARLPLLGKLVGRLQDCMKLPCGRLLSPNAVRDFFAETDDVKQYQIVQESFTKIRVKLVVEELKRNEVERAVRAGLEMLLGKEPEIDFQYVEGIEMPRSGKIRTVISEI